MEETIHGKPEVQEKENLECGHCGRTMRQGRGFAFKVVQPTDARDGEEQISQITKCIYCAIRHSAMLRRSLSVAVVVGTVLTFLNQGDTIFAAEWKSDLYWKVPLTYCVPFCVATYGALSNNRR